jgi:hypothetical protein
MDSGHNSKRSRAESGHPKPFRVFLASPGDVALERKLAREAITYISSERRFRGRIDIEIIAWDQPGAAVAMEAGLTPQEAIAQGLPKPEDCDLAVIVLWSRIGTPLPADFELKADGTPYLSGTELECFALPWSGNLHPGTGADLFWPRTGNRRVTATLRRSQGAVCRRRRRSPDRVSPRWSAAAPSHRYRRPRAVDRSAFQTR